MTTSLVGKRILFGVTGSIAAYKAAGWVRDLTSEGAIVQAVLTRGGSRFVTPLTLEALSGHRVYGDIFESGAGAGMTHINLARESDLIVIAPATANTIARLAGGLADELLLTLVLAAGSVPVLVFPAMNSMMYTHPATRANIERLKLLGYRVIEPDSGALACGEEGPGRLVGWEAAREAMLAAVIPQDLEGQTVTVTAGPTWEVIDPARHLGNRSSGRMGYALARIARRRGAAVTLISGPGVPELPPGIKVVKITSAQEMYDAVLDCYDRSMVIIKAAAVADYRPAEISGEKIKKKTGGLTLELVQNPDILFELGQRNRKNRKKKAQKPILVGFAAESRDHLTEGRRKLKEKNLDLIVINDILGEDTGFAVDTNQVTIIGRNNRKEILPLCSKEETADRIWDQIRQLLPYRPVTD